MNKIILVGIGGFLGSISRFGISYLIQRYVVHPFPLATLLVNALGSVSIGLLFEFFKNHHLLPTITLFCAIGFLGSFTTFSTFSFETVELFRRNELYLASLNVMGNLVLCLSGVVLGSWMGSCLKI